MMKNLVVLFVFVVGLVLVGCQRRLPEEPETYDADTEAPASALIVRVDPKVADDQKAISDEVQRSRAGAEEEAAPEAEEEGEVTTRPTTGEGGERPAPEPDTGLEDW